MADTDISSDPKNQRLSLLSLAPFDVQKVSQALSALKGQTIRLSSEIIAANNATTASYKRMADSAARALRISKVRPTLNIPEVIERPADPGYDVEFVNMLAARKEELAARRRKISEEAAAANRPTPVTRKAPVSSTPPKGALDMELDADKVAEQVAEYNDTVNRILAQKAKIARFANTAQTTPTLPTSGRDYRTPGLKVHPTMFDPRTKMETDIISRTERLLDLFPGETGGASGATADRLYEKLTSITRLSRAQLASANPRVVSQLDAMIRAMETGQGGRFRLMGGRYTIPQSWFSRYNQGPDFRDPNRRQFVSGMYSQPYSLSAGMGPGLPDLYDQRLYTRGPGGPRSFVMSTGRNPIPLLPGPGQTSHPETPLSGDLNRGFVLVPPEMLRLGAGVQPQMLPAGQSYPLLPAGRQPLMLPGPGQTSHPETAITNDTMSEIEKLRRAAEAQANASRYSYTAAEADMIIDAVSKKPTPSAGVMHMPAESGMLFRGETNISGDFDRIRPLGISNSSLKSNLGLDQAARSIDALATAEKNLTQASNSATTAISKQATTTDVSKQLGTGAPLPLGKDATAAERRRAEREAERARKQAAQEAEAMRKRAALQGSLDYLPGGDQTKMALLENAGQVEFSRRVQDASGNTRIVRDRLRETDIKDVKHQYGGVTDVTFQARDANEVMQQYSATIDKYGRITTRANKRTLDFASAVGKETLEFMKWSVAISLVLVPLQKLAELSQQAIENQRQLADILIITNQAQSAGNAIFSAAADIASETGENVDNVLGAYAMAYRVTGNAANATQRFVQTNKLLKDSLILSKLSGMDAAESIDILSAAINQTNGKFDEGQLLINKWVAVSKVANVDVKTLATGFAVVAEAADDAQLSVDELNGLMATIAATGTTSAKETANVARSLISGLQSDKARKTLLSYGIAFQDAEGNARSFYDVVKDIYDMKQLGILSDTQVSDITRAWGGGTRRQAAAAAFLSKFDMVRKVAAESEKATLQSGEAMAALAVQSLTVSFNINKLETAFSSLAQAIGTSGGVLDLFTVLLQVMTGVTNVATSLTGALGKSTLPLIGILAAAGLSKKAGADFIPSMRNKFAGIADANYSIRNFFSPIDRIKTPRNLAVSAGTEFDLLRESVGMSDTGYRTSIQRERINKREENRRRLAGAAGYYASGAILTANILGNIADQDAGQEKWYRAGADIAGGVIGALASKGSPIGTQIGISIAEAFLNGVVLYKPEFSELLGGIMADSTETADAEANATLVAQEAYREEVLRGAGGGSRILGTILSGLGVTAGKIFDPKTAKDMTQYQAAVLAYKSTLSPEEIADLDKRQNALSAAELEITGEGLNTEAFRQIQLGYQTQFKDLADNTSKAYIDRLREKMLTGQITQTEFGSGVQRLSGLGVMGSQYMASFGEAYMRKYNKNPEDMYGMFGNIASYAGQEEIDTLNSFSAEIATAYSQMSLLAVGTQEYNDALSDYNTATENALLYTEQLTQALAARVQLKDIVSLEELDRAGTQEALKYGEQFWNESLEQQLKAGVFESRAAMEDYKAGQESRFYRYGEYGGPSGYLESNVPEFFVSQGAKYAEDTGLIQKKMGVSFMDATDAQLQQALTKYEDYIQLLESKGYERDESSEVVVTKDETIDVYKKDWKIVQYLLGEIIDNQEDQMEGLYNFPADMFAMVAYDANAMRGTDTGAIDELIAKLGQNELPEQESPYPGVSMSWEDIKENLDKAKARLKVTTTTPIGTAPGSDEWEKRWKEMRTYQQFPEGIPTATEQLFKRIDKPSPINFPSNSYFPPGMSLYPDDRTGGLRWTKYGIGVGQLPVGGAGTGTPQASAGVGTLGASTASMAMPMMLLSGLVKGLSGLQNVGSISGSAKQSNVSGLSQEISGIAKNLTTRLSLQVDNKISLTIDGRQLAYVMKRYMKEDLVRYGAAGGAVTRTNII